MYKELFEYIWQQKKWWLIPPIIFLILFGLIIVVAELTPVGPFIYMMI